MYACLRFDNDRGVGWEISRERAIEILRETDKAGLMHTADYHGDPATAGAICNCCTDCCYPHLATDRLGTSDVWPVRRYVAEIDEAACTRLWQVRPALPVRGHHVRRGQAAAARAFGLPRLRRLRDRLQRRRDRDAAARAGLRGRLPPALSGSA